MVSDGREGPVGGATYLAQLVKPVFFLFCSA